MNEWGLGAIGQIARHVTNIEESIAWYRDVLGLPFLYRYGDLAFFDCAGTRLFLSTEAGSSPAGNSVLYFHVYDIEAAWNRLLGRGVGILQAPHMIFKHPDGVEEWMAFFRDPDGQPLALMSQTVP